MSLVPTRSSFGRATGRYSLALPSGNPEEILKFLLMPRSCRNQAPVPTFWSCAEIIITTRSVPMSTCYQNEGITMSPQISLSPLTSLKKPIGRPNWIYELKHDGFRGVPYVDANRPGWPRARGRSFVSLTRFLGRCCAASKVNVRFLMVRSWCWMRKAARTSTISWHIEANHVTMRSISSG